MRSMNNATLTRTQDSPVVIAGDVSAGGARSRMLAPEQYYTPAQPVRQQQASPLPMSIDTHNIVMVSAPHAGIGSSVLAAMLAWTLAQRGLNVSLVDLDVDSGGGLDVLLGLENESGLRLAQIDAPLGRIDGNALCHEAMQWEGVHVLARDASEPKCPDIHEIRSILGALGESCDVVVVDAGRARLYEELQECRKAVQVVAVEMSVLGLVRGKAHYARMQAWECSSISMVGIAPRGSKHGRGVVDVDEASEYLNASLVGVIAHDAGLCSDVLEGLGIRAISKANRRAVEQLTDLVQGRAHPSPPSSCHAPRTRRKH